MIRRLLDVFFPKRCVGCGKEGQYICKDCEIFLSEADPGLRNLVSKNEETKFLSPIVSVWEYEGIVEKAIWKIKFDHKYHIIDELVEKAFEKIELNLPENCSLTFVPMYRKRERERGFNQAELIARKLGQLLSRAEQPMLEKVRDNRSQVGLSPQERLENVKGVFAFKSEARNPKSETNPNNQNSKFQADSFEFRYSNFEIPPKVIVVDDVYTTGATMNECMRVLREAGVRQVYGFALARKMRI